MWGSQKVAPVSSLGLPAAKRLRSQQLKSQVACVQLLEWCGNAWAAASPQTSPPQAPWGQTDSPTSPVSVHDTETACDHEVTSETGLRARDQPPAHKSNFRGGESQGEAEDGNSVSLRCGVTKLLAETAVLVPAPAGHGPRCPPVLHLEGVELHLRSVPGLPRPSATWY